MYSAEGHYIGCKQVPNWHSKIQLPAIFIVVTSILIGIGIIIALNGVPNFNRQSAQSVTRDLPF